MTDQAYGLTRKDDDACFQEQAVPEGVVSEEGSRTAAVFSLCNRPWESK
jgi:hypothetical protein